MIAEWIQVYLHSLNPYLVIKMESYVTKQDVHVVNAWFMMEDGRYGLLSVIHDGRSVLGSMLPRRPSGRIGTERSRRKFDLSRNVIFSENREDLVIEKRFNKATLEQSLERVLMEGASRLQGVKFLRYAIRSVEVVTHFWRISIWDTEGLLAVMDIDVFDPRVRDEDLPMGMKDLLEKILGGALSGAG